MSGRDGAFENHALTILPTVEAFAEAAWALVERGTAGSAVGLVALGSTLRAPIAAEDCPNIGECAGLAASAHDQACRLPSETAMELLQFPAEGAQLAASRGHVLDRLSAALGAGAAGLAEALGRSVSARDGEEFARAVLGGSVLIWTMATSFEEASAIASLLLARSAERVCTFTSPRSAGGRNRPGGGA